MYQNYLEDYYLSKINVEYIARKTGTDKTTFNRWLKRNGHLPRQSVLKLIDTGIPELNQTLKDRYSSIVNRCNGKSTDRYGHYAGKSYMGVIEWVDFCNSKKDELKKMWEMYEKHNKKSRYAVSVDRVDETAGYEIGNAQFVTHGFNSWKRSINPVEVTKENKHYLFMTCHEASRFFVLRKQAIGEMLSGDFYKKSGYAVTKSSVEEVLSYSNTSNLAEYYTKILNGTEI